MTDTSSERLKSAGWFFWAKFSAAFIFLGVMALLIFTPGYTDWHSGPRQNESAAIGSLRLLNRLERQYALEHPNKGFGCELSMLRPTERVNGYTDEHVVKLLTGEFSGYRFEFVDCTTEANGIVTRYQVTAVPVKRGETGNRAFCTNESGELFYDAGGSAANCSASRRLI